MKKRITGIVLILACIVSFGFAEEVEIKPFRIHTPRSIGMGNAYNAISTGYESFWINPAGLRTEKTEINFFNLAVTVLGNPGDVFSAGQSMFDADGGSNILSSLKQVVTGSGVGLNAGGGFSWIGKGFGAGIFNSFDLYMQGDPFPAGVEGYVDNTISLMFGYALSIPLPFGMKVTAGADIRPSLKLRGAIDARMVEKLLLEDNADVMKYFTDILKNKYFAFPVDIGAKVELPLGFVVSMSANDIFGKYFGGDTDYYVNWGLNFGAAWQPDLKAAANIIKPTISLELSNINRIIAEETGFWRELKVGCEVALFKSIVLLWAGLDGGYPSFGGGFDIGVFEIGVAYGTTEYGRYLGDCPVPHLTFELAIRLD
ncbi:hypothetical protein K7I13_13495 [Brucepastera parasyntrophica]|uniref:hypothetical protein n=1 Tax=Brucepastera parasyntrophica TaxID=2880008 RepID=UPI00210D5BF8|nr:hypothetical protein [Brucepastera parasyntrophica]ULQ59472.1 hypothetical protein K7I13_13495 [Brucepastera parasyntrophica]